MEYNKQLFEDFISRLRDEYLESRKTRLFFDAGENLVRRGRSASISSATENMVACLIAKELERHGKKDFVIFVDIPISIKGYRSPKYPDIVVCLRDGSRTREIVKGRKKKTDDMPELKHYKICYMCDVKTDAGWIRGEGAKICDNHANVVLDICNNGIKKGSVNKEDISMECAEGTCYDVVVVSECNGSIEGEANPQTPYSKWYILTQGSHTNEYDAQKYSDNPPKPYIKNPDCGYEAFLSRVIATIPD